MSIPDGGPEPSEISFIEDEGDNPYVGAPQIAI